MAFIAFNDFFRIEDSHGSDGIKLHNAQIQLLHVIKPKPMLLDIASHAGSAGAHKRGLSIFTVQPR